MLQVINTSPRAAQLNEKYHRVSYFTAEEHMRDNAQQYTEPARQYYHSGD